ncbi:ROK family protein [Lapidilactobacillus luobeiensis]|uniref:ROK family protein n=1 Tax=Lapidilactobacillus luobeiensis TaxID=2950371 RepID=UPI0021C2F116|nr:ROK family protein [Lapidilactobacillus luobeiensis]
MARLLGGIEAGGTKFVCAVGEASGKVTARVKFPTTTPEATLAQVFAFFDQYEVAAIGVGSFGPIDIEPQSATYGYITDTPKLAWKNFDFLGALKVHYPAVKFVWTTDVNVAAYGEYLQGAGVGKQNICYVTVGTGIGVGYISHGKLYSGRSHPEAGHIMMHRAADDDFVGVCPYHGDCLEGIAAGPAIERRNGKKGHEIAPDDPFWQIEAYYLAQACMTYTLTFSPDLIVFGGGVSKQAQLFPLIRAEFAKLMHDYVRVPDLELYIQHVKLGDDAGITGSLLVAADAVK